MVAFKDNFNVDDVPVLVLHMTLLVVVGGAGLQHVGSTQLELLSSLTLL